MKLTLSVLALATGAELGLDSPILGVEKKWDLFTATFDKSYEHESAREKAFAAFAANDAIIRDTNAKGLSYTLGHNKFSDMTLEEFTATYLGGMRADDIDRSSLSSAAPLNATIPQEIDWVAEGAVGPVKNQEQCGSCWAFSTVGAVEGRYQIAGNELTAFSEEELVACDMRNNGCHGGVPTAAFQFVQDNGLPLEECYPYTSGDGHFAFCDNADKCKPVVTLSSYKQIEGEEAILEGISSGPISIAVAASTETFMLYKEGVLTDAECGNQIDHAVVAVGYGTDNGVPYYKIRNSWGAAWGEEGYIRIERGQNTCGVEIYAAYPSGVKKILRD